ncbi:Ig-like domain-containing protein [uncultured Eubacterium sp.]|uniref:Ig-like domain-containing protein n=1 Tax=uncultured Eubacterium sp. TaxID=165185 RepID=UPI0025F49A71|nr:Ig-like domain-containing protein [uncultured Eubacterium sp.]
MRKVLGMLCACLLLVSSVGTGIQVQAENGANRVVKNEKDEMKPENLFAYEAFDGSKQVSVVKADTETGWTRENVLKDEIDETSRLIYNGPVSVRVELPEKKATVGDTDGKDSTDDEDVKDSVDDKNNIEDKNDNDNERKVVEKNAGKKFKKKKTVVKAVKEDESEEKEDGTEKNEEETKGNEGNGDKNEKKDDYKNFVVSIFHNGTEIWHAAIEKEETLDFICRISEWKWQKESQAYVLQVFCFAEGDYQILVEEKMNPDVKGDEEIKSDEKDEDKADTDKRDRKNDESDSEVVKLIEKSATVTVDRTPPEAYLSWRKKETTAGNVQADGTQLVELSVLDANFRPSEVEWKVLVKKNKTERQKHENRWTDESTSSLKKWSDWRRDKEEKNLWHATVPLHADGQYQMELKYTDLAGHSLQKNCMGTLVIDTVSPLLTVDYPTPVQKQNGKLYYAEKIDFVLNVTEENFRPEDFVLSLIKNEAVEDVQTEWKAIGTTQYQTTVSLGKDGEYEIKAAYIDSYGNEMEPYQSEKIVVDQMAPEIKVLGIYADTAEKTAISDAVLQIQDKGNNLNTESIQPMLKRVVTGVDGTYLTEEVLLPEPVKNQNTGVCSYRIPELTEDGIYTLTCQAEDYSGNKIHEIKTEDGIAHQQVKFSINHGGSVFEVDDSVIELTERYYIYGVESDVEIREINTDLIEDYKVRLNGTVLQEGRDFTTDAVTGENSWSVRRYVVKKDVFAKEGEYHLVVESEDKTGTKAYSDVKKMQLSWVVDQSAPSVLLFGLEADHVYETEEQPVTAIPSDEGGKLKTFQVSVTDDLGENRKMLVNMSGEKLEQYLKEHDGQVQFTISEGVEQQIEIFCADQAWKKDGSTNEYHEVIQGVFVAKNQRSLRRMKRDLEKRLKEKTEQSESGMNTEVQQRMPVTTIVVIAAIVGAVCCAAVTGGRRKKKR